GLSRARKGIRSNGEDPAISTQAIRGARGLVLKWGAGRFYQDTVLLSVSLGLMLFGLVMVSSASLHQGENMASDSFY
ncbi:hypothetical protein ACRRRV_16230, partial [Methylococcus sp. S1B]